MAEEIGSNAVSIFSSTVAANRSATAERSFRSRISLILSFVSRASLILVSSLPICSLSS